VKLKNGFQNQTFSLGFVRLCSERYGVKEVQEQGMLDSVGQANHAIDESMLVKHVDSYSAFSVSDSDLRTVLIENWLAHAPKNFVV